MLCDVSIMILYDGEGEFRTRFCSNDVYGMNLDSAKRRDRLKERKADDTVHRLQYTDNCSHN